jgi:hypothetical protein
MNKIIFSENDLKEFLSYCVSWGYDPVCINKEFPFQGSPWKFIFRLKKPIKEIDLKNIRYNAPSVKLYTIKP